jgi:lipid-binding SYLF domain-containing protein
MKLIKTSACCTVLLSAVAMGVGGCNTAPKTEEARVELTSDAQKALQQMETDAPDLTPVVTGAYAYAIFPSVGQGAFGVGGAHGHGEVYQGGALIGYSELSLVNVGLQVGGQEYSELLIFRTKDALDKFTNNNLAFQAGVSAVILKSGAAAEAKWQDDVAVFTRPKAGAMVEAAIGGQRFTYKSVLSSPPPMTVTPATTSGT